MSNKKTFLFVIALIVLVIGLSTINAAKVANDTNDNQITTQSTKDIKVTSDDTNKVQTDKKTITKKEVKTKKEVTKHNITSQNFEQYFDSSGELNSTVKDGDILDIQGEIFKNQSMYIRKPLIITSTTNNAHINLNTTSKGDQGENPGNSFTLFKGASYSNVSNIYFENTQIFVKNATGIILNNISTYAHDQTVGAGVGTVAIREYSDNITIENSHFKSENNGGRSTVVFTGVKNSLFRNNTITGKGIVGNLFYLNAYNLGSESPSDTSLNTNNTIRDNYINGTEAVAQSICYAVAICGEDNSFINNTIYHNGTGINTATVTSNNVLSVRTKIINNTIPYNSVQTPDNGTVQGNKIGTLIYATNNSKVTDNTVTNVTIETTNVTIDKMNIPGEIKFYDKVDGLVISNSSIMNISLYGSSSSKYKNNIKILNNNITFFQIGSGRNAYVSNFTLSNNNISNPIVIEGRNARNIDILNNTIIIKDKEAAINVSSPLIDSKIAGNYLIAGEKYANDAIYLNNPIGVTIGTNYPIRNAILTVTPSKNHLYRGEKLNITTTLLKENQEGFENQAVTIIVDNQTFNGVTNSSGQYTFEFTPSTIGKNDIFAQYDQVSQYKPCNATNTFKYSNPEPYETKITVVPSKTNVIIGQKLNITTTLTEKDGTLIKKQEVKITVDGQTFNGITNSNGVYVFEFTSKTLGLNNIVAKFEGNEDYKASNATNSFTVIKPEPVATTLTVTPSKNSVVLGDKLNITAKLVKSPSTPVANQKVSITVGGQQFNGTTNNNGQYTFEFTTKTIGINNIVARFAGNDDYKASNATNTFTVTKPEPVATILTVTPSKSNVVLGDKLNITTKLVKAGSVVLASQKISVTVDGQTFNGITNSNGVYVFEFTSKTLGLNNIVAKFEGNEDYKASNATNSFTVIKPEPVATTLTVTPSKNSVVLGDKLNITAKLVKSPSTPVANQKVSITVGGQQFNGTTNNNGQYTFEFTTKTIGINNIVARFAGNDDYKASNATNTFTVTKPLPVATKLTAQINGTKVGKTGLSATLTDQTGKAIPNAKLLIMVDQNNTNNLTTNNQGKVTSDLNLNASNHIVQVIYQGNDDFKANITTLPVNVTKNDVNITLVPVKGIIGENITLTAYLKDLEGNNITGGNLAFKLNGKTLRSDGRFDSKAPAMKFSVKNGLVTYTIKADLYLRNAKNLTASYSGTSKYAEITSKSVEAQIQKRYANVTVTVTPKITKQYESITIKVTAKDTTKNGKNQTLITDNTQVMLKINGVTLKDSKGKTLLLPIQKDKTATYTYTIPSNMGGVTSAGKARNYPVTAIFTGVNYYPGARNVTTFQVQRSATYVNITQATVTKTNVLSVKATLKDYKGNYLKGTNKVTIKINGKNYVDPKNGKAKYWSVKDGVVNLSGIQVDPKTTIKRVMVVTGERQAYTEGRNETTKIIRV